MPRWTETEEKLVRVAWITQVPVERIGDAVGRSAAAVRSKARCLGLARTRTKPDPASELTDDEEEALRVFERAGLSVGAAARALGRTEETIRKSVWKQRREADYEH